MENTSDIAFAVAFLEVLPFCCFVSFLVLYLSGAFTCRSGHYVGPNLCSLLYNSSFAQLIYLLYYFFFVPGLLHSLCMAFSSSFGFLCLFDNHAKSSTCQPLGDRALPDPSPSQRSHTGGNKVKRQVLSTTNELL